MRSRLIILYFFKLKFLYYEDVVIINKFNLRIYISTVYVLKKKRRENTYYIRVYDGLKKK